MTSKKEPEKIKIDIAPITIIKVIAIVLGALMLLSFIKIISHALILIFISTFLAMALNPAVSFIARKLKSKSRVRATGLAYLLVTLVVVSFFLLVIPPLVRQTIDFIKEVPATISSFQSADSTISGLISEYNLDDQIDQFSADFKEQFKNVGQPILATAGTVGTFVVSTVVVFVLTFMILVEGPFWLKRFFEIQPKNKRAKRQRVFNRIYRQVTGYVNGQLLIAIVAGIFAFVALVIASSIFDAEINEIALAAIVSLFALLPMIGATIGSVIVIFACLLVSLPLAITMAIYFIVYQQIENLTVQPLIQSRSSNLTPLTVFIAAIVGISFGGILGALIAIPTAGSLKILLEEYYLNRAVE